MNKHFDIAVIGGGAGGLFFSALAADIHNNLKIAVIEKNQRVGKKLLSTGNGRCNLTNLYISADNYHGSFKPYVKDIINNLDTHKLLELLRSLGLLTRADDFGRVYPKSNQASTVLDVLRYNCESENIDFYCENKVTDIEKCNNKFIITTDKNTFSADKVIISTGGAAAPKVGGDKSGYELLSRLGHTVIKPSPALCPVTVKSEHLKSLKGIRVQGEISLICEGKTIAAEEGEIQFTETSLSGICVFNLSQYIENSKDYILRIKLMPEADFNEICDILKNNRNVFANLETDNIMTGIFHKRISQALIKTAKISFTKKVKDLTESEIKTIAKLINNFEFKVSGLADFNNAQVTKGGVKGNEVNPETMESKKRKGLYIIGEALDCNGDCGGYNLHFALATAYKALKGL